MTWDVLDNDDLGPDKILTTGTANALYGNPRAMAQRESGTPSFVQVPVREYKTTGTGATWTIPDGVTAFNIIVQGGGGGAGGAGGASSFVYNSVTYTGNGGAAGSNGVLVAGGTATGGDVNVDGQAGDGTGSPRGGSSMLGHGGIGSSAPGTGYGAGGSRSTVGPVVLAGGGGGTCYKRIAVVPGQTTATYTVGAAGAASSGDGPGAAGVIIIEY